MPRDTSGNYTLPPENPVFPNDTIETAWANDTMTDLGSALTDSLSRSGKGGMLVPLKFNDGAIGAPGMTWVNEPTSGIYRAATNDFRWSIFGQDVVKFAPSGIVFPAGKGITGGTFSGLTITSGTIDNAPIGATTPSTGKFTTLSATLKVDAAGGVLNLDSVGAGFLQIGGVNQYKWDGAKFSPDNALDNARDLGILSGRWRSAYFGQGVTVSNGGPYKLTRNSGLAVVNGMGFDAGSDTLRFRTGGGNPDTEFIDTGAQVFLRLHSSGPNGVTMGSWPVSGN